MLLNLKPPRARGGQGSPVLGLSRGGSQHAGSFTPKKWEHHHTSRQRQGPRQSRAGGAAPAPAGATRAPWGFLRAPPCCLREIRALLLPGKEPGEMRSVGRDGDGPGCRRAPRCPPEPPAWSLQGVSPQNAPSRAATRDIRPWCRGRTAGNCAGASVPIV